MAHGRDRFAQRVSGGLREEIEVSVIYPDGAWFRTPSRALEECWWPCNQSLDSFRCRISCNANCQKVLYWLNAYGVEQLCES